MYIKQVIKGNGKTNKKYKYFHLVESVRTEKGPRQHLILNLGKIDLDPSRYHSLSRRISDILTGQMSFHEVPLKIEQIARRAATKIFDKNSRKEEEVKSTDFQKVDINSLKTMRSRSFGGEYLCSSIWKELRITNFLLQSGVSPNTIPILKALVLNRLIDPGSERYTREWADNRSALYEIIERPLYHSLNSYYRGGDALFKVKDKLEQYLCSKEKTLFSLQENIFFFDLTNTYFEGEQKGNPKAQFGRSKEKRTDCRLVTLGMIVDEKGFAKYSKIFPGNQAEAETLSGMIRALKKNLTPGSDKNIVLDAGIATSKNIHWLKENKYHYIVVNRGKLPFLKDFSDMKTIRGIDIKRFEVEEEAYILCRSKRKEAKEKSMRTRIEKLFSERLQYFKQGLTKKHGTKNYQRVVEIIGRLKEKYPQVAKLYSVQVIPETGKDSSNPRLKAIALNWEKKKKYEQEIISEGSYVLRTDRIDLSDEEIWNTYIMLGNIEYAWLTMKSYLGLRPNFHQKEKRVDTHMFISVLAYHILHIIEYRFRMSGDHRKWSTIRDILSTHRRVTIAFRMKDEEGKITQKFIRTCTVPEVEHKKIYHLFGLSGKTARISSLVKYCSDHRNT